MVLFAIRWRHLVNAYELEAGIVLFAIRWCHLVNA